MSSLSVKSNLLTFVFNLIIYLKQDCNIAYPSSVFLMTIRGSFIQLESDATRSLQISSCSTRTGQAEKWVCNLKIFKQIN